MPIKDILFSFKGRLNRQRFFLALFGLCSADAVLQLAFMHIIGLENLDFAPMFLIPLWVAYCVIFFWAGLALNIKRLHDINKSGWNLLWVFLPLIGSIMLWVWTWFRKGTAGSNRFGEELPAASSRESNRNLIFIWLMVVFCLGSGFIGATSAVKNSRAYIAAVSYISANNEVKVAVGDIKDFGKMPNGKWEVHNGAGVADLDINIHGSTGNAEAMLHLTKQPGKDWEVTNFTLVKKP